MKSGYLPYNDLSDQLDIFLLSALKLVGVLDEFNSTHGVYGCLCSQAVLYDGDRFSLVDPDSLKEDSFLLAPEQRNPDDSSSVDFRTDLFGLGVVFYEMLMGRLPEVNDYGMPMLDFSENKLIPSSIILMINKLCFRVPSDRYHSFLSLKDDLSRMLQEFQTTGEISHFFPGATDVPTKLVFHDFLYGRDSERGQVQLFLEQVKASSLPSILLVSGYSGVGKTSFVNQVLDECLDGEVVRFQGKFDQDSTRPYSALVSCVLSYVRPLIQDALARGIWKKRLSQALFPNGFVLTHFIPELSALIEDQEELELTDPEKIKNRFNLTFVKFLKVLAQGKTVSLFVDDLQWADSASLQLIGFLLNQVDFKVIFVGAYRSNEYEHNLEFCSFLDHYLPSHAQKGSISSSSDFSELKHLVFQLSLSGLDLRTLSDFLTDLLGHSTSDISALASIILAKTHGNPFFIRQFLLNLVESGFLIFEPEARAWMWDLDVLRTLDISDNVVDMVVHRIQALPLATQRALQVGACLGNSFSLRELALASGIEAFNCELDLWAAVNLGLVASVDRNGLFRFLHDRVQQSAFQLILKEDLAAFRFGVALRLIEGFSEVELENRLFVVVDNFNFGVLESSDLVLQGIGLNYRAGKKAKGLAAFSEALRYFEVGAGLIETLDDSDRFGDRFEFLISFIEILFICKEFDRAEDLAEVVLAQTEDVLVKGRVYQLLVRQYSYVGQFDRAIECGILGLHLLGFKLSHSFTGLHALYWVLYDVVKAPSIASMQARFTPEHTISEDKTRQILSMLSELLVPLYLSGHKSLMLTHIIRSFYFTLSNGITEESPYIIVLYSIYLRFVRLKFPFSRSVADIGIGLCSEKYPSHYLKAYYMYDSSFFYWDELFELTDKSQQPLIALGLNTGDLFHASLAMYETMARSRVLNLEEKTKLYTSTQIMSKNIGSNEIYYISLTYTLYAHFLRSEPCFPVRLDDSSTPFSEVARYLNKIQHASALCAFNTLLLKLHIKFGRFDDCVPFIQDSKKYLKGILGSFECIDYWFYSFLFYTYQLRTSFNISYFIESKKSWRMIKILSKNAPDTFNHLYFIGKGFLLESQKKYREAAAYYSKAIHFCQVHTLLEYEAFASECLAEVYYKLKDEPNYSDYFDKTVHLYTQWGALGKVRTLIKKNFSLL